MKLKDKVWFPVLYMFIMTLVLSAVLIFFGVFTRKQVRTNELLAFERSVLEALDIDVSSYSPGQIHAEYVKAVRVLDAGMPDVLGFYDNEELVGYALPLSGPGFWAPIKGIVGIGVDTRSIVGISFYEQNETPGLGGEIVKPFFRDQFKDKKIAQSGIPIEFKMSTVELDENSVHTITGATQTSMRLGKILNEKLTAWRDQMKSKEQ